MKELVVTVGMLCAFVLFLTRPEERVNRCILTAFLWLTLVTYVCICMHIHKVVAITHILFIFLIYLASLCTTRFAMGFFTCLAGIALTTRMYYGKCIYKACYDETYAALTSGSDYGNDRQTDLVYWVPLIIIAIRCVIIRCGNAPDYARDEEGTCINDSRCSFSKSVRSPKDRI